MIVRHEHTVYELLSVFVQPIAEMNRLRELLCEPGALSYALHLGTAFEEHPGGLTCSDWLPVD